MSMSRTRTISSWSSANTASLMTSLLCESGKKEGVGWKRTCETFFVAAGHPHDGLCIPLWGLDEAFSVWIFADALEDGANGGDHAFLTGGAFEGGCVQTRDGGLCCGGE